MAPAFLSRCLRAAATSATAALLCGPAAAINKCTQADGKVVYQDAACGIAAAGKVQVKTWGAGQADAGATGTTAAGAKRVDPNSNMAGPAEAGQLLAIYRRWMDAERLASATGRIALSGPVATMQAVQREAEAVAVPLCLGDAKVALVDLTSKSTTALIEFMRKNELQSMVYTIVDRGALIRAFESRVEGASCEKAAAK